MCTPLRLSIHKKAHPGETEIKVIRKSVAYGGYPLRPGGLEFDWSTIRC